MQSKVSSGDKKLKNKDVREAVEYLIKTKNEFSIYDLYNYLKKTYLGIYLEDVKSYMPWCEQFYSLRKNGLHYSKESSIMNQLHVEVRKIIDLLIVSGKMFTVYDVTRILCQREPNIKHDDVRSWVRWNFSNGVFPKGWTNNTGDHLKYSPAPHIYAPPGADIKKYNPNELDPNPVNAAVMPAKKTVNFEATPSPATEYWYALVNKKTGKRVTSKSKGNNDTGLYKTRNGPSQFSAAYNSEYEIVKYEVLLKAVK